MSAQIVARSPNSLDKDGLKFLQEMVPAAEKTALYFNISYLCLAKFPELEKIIKTNAREAEEAFRASEDLLKECTKTSHKMVTILFPTIRDSVEKEDIPKLISQLGDARRWIKDMNQKVDEMEKEYMDIVHHVAEATSEVNKVKVELKEEREELHEDLQQSRDNVKQWEKTAGNVRKRLHDCRSNLDAADRALHNISEDIASRNHKFAIAAAAVPLIGMIVYASQLAANEAGDKHRLEKARIKIRDLESKEDTLEEELQRAEQQVDHWKMQVTEYSTQYGAIPDPVFLTEVQPSLTKIQETFVKLKGFWEKVEKLVENLQQKTFVGEYLIEVLEVFKEEFLDSIKMAELVWSDFEDICALVSNSFTLRTKDAYKFLQTSPSSLSDDEWRRQYDELKNRLKNVKPKLM